MPRTYGVTSNTSLGQPAAPFKWDLKQSYCVGQSPSPTHSMAEPARDVSSQSDVKHLKREADGSFNRAPSTFRDIIQEGSKYEPEKGICHYCSNTDGHLRTFTATLGRYHLYVSYGCPWASRTLIVRKLKGLEDTISMSAVSPRMDSNGWPFASVDPFPGAEDDPVYNARYLKDIYLSVEPHYQGR
jgi:putative glutathione S-transferase